jgi:ASC-1-like (ASCH) protein
MENFEELIQKDDSLSQLLNDKTITVFSNFSRTAYSEELKNHIQDRYYASFKEILRQDPSKKKEGEVNAFMRSLDFLATEKTKTLIAEDFLELLITANENLLAFKESLSDPSGIIEFRFRLDEAISGAVINVLNKLGAYEKINEHRIIIINSALDICDLVAEVNPKREPFKYEVYNAILNNLEKIDDFGPLRERFETHKRKASKKGKRIEIKYGIVMVIVSILIIIKILTLIDRVI